MKFKYVYALLKRVGNSPVKALEIVIDARRGKGYARDWVAVAFKQRHSHAR